MKTGYIMVDDGEGGLKEKTNLTAIEIKGMQWRDATPEEEEKARKSLAKIKLKN